MSKIGDITKQFLDALHDEIIYVRQDLESLEVLVAEIEAEQANLRIQDFKKGQTAVWRSMSPDARKSMPWLSPFYKAPEPFSSPDA
ncbi:MAG: hypothetical protein KDI11_08175 [Alphaproteobacteria bacterium]|mgnify:CR=1 FL=1|nr:hypothetical protein [Alphaproteobacteria bacterium]